MSSRARAIALTAAGVVVVGLAAAAVFFLAADAGTDLSGGAQPAAAGETNALLDGIPQHGPALGAPGAPVTLVEYADLQCPACAAWAADELPELVERYVRPGRLRIVFRGLAFIGADSERALRVALAAGRQGRLWHVVALLYANRGPESSGWATDELFRSIAASVPGLDGKRMLAERDGRAVGSELAAARSEAQAADVGGTLAFRVGRTGGELRTVPRERVDAEIRRLLRS